MYVPADKYKAQPIRVNIGGEVFAIGGDIPITMKPPKKSGVIKEATQEQYEAAYRQYTSRNGKMAKAVLKVKDKPERTGNKDKEPDGVHSEELKEPDSGTG